MWASTYADGEGDYENGFEDSDENSNGDRNENGLGDTDRDGYDDDNGGANDGVYTIVVYDIGGNRSTVLTEHSNNL